MYSRKNQKSNKDVNEYGEPRSAYIVHDWGGQRFNKVVGEQMVKNLVFEELSPKSTEKKNGLY